jgi:pimeloyl-ACP methyl ester carboxylesterase
MTNGPVVRTRNTYPRQVLIVLVSAVLACAGAHATGAGPLATQAQPSAHTPLPVDRPNIQAKGARNRTAAAPPPQAEPSPTVPRGRVYLFRGALGLIFSRGMDRLTEKIQRAGIAADVYEFTVCNLIMATAIETYRQDPAPIILIGHSMGGRCALQIAEKLQAEGISVSLIVTIDPAHLSPEVPANVERFINIFLSKDVLGGGDIKPVQGFPGHYASYDLDQHGDLHISIDKADAIHQQLVAKIREIATTPAKTDGEVVPLRYVVPPKQDTELWDSGMAVAARAGDTLQTIAAQYHVPLWSLTQANAMPDSALLSAGQRVVVPRHLMPAPVTAASQPVSSSGR